MDSGRDTDFKGPISLERVYRGFCISRDPGFGRLQQAGGVPSQVSESRHAAPEVNGEMNGVIT